LDFKENSKAVIGIDSEELSNKNIVDFMKLWNKEEFKPGCFFEKLQENEGGNKKRMEGRRLFFRIMMCWMLLLLLHIIKQKIMFLQKDMNVVLGKQKNCIFFYFLDAKNLFVFWNEGLITILF